MDALDAIPDPLERLDAVREAREALEALEGRAVVDARRAGVTWKAIGGLYRLSKQGAQQRFRAAASGEPGTPPEEPPG
jgi:curved DNA-binding protein CbpA